MFGFKVSRARQLFSLTFLLNLPLHYAAAEPNVSNSMILEWGASARTYTYVFSGLVTCQKHPCSNASINLELQTTSEGGIAQETRAGEDGRYQFEVTLRGAPLQSSTWRLKAHSSSVVNDESAEAQGSIILMEGQTTVVVDRSLPLVQA